MGRANRRRARRPRPRARAAACASAVRRLPRSSSRRPGSRSSSLSARPTRRSRWGSSSRARGAARTGARRRRAWRTARCSRCGSRSASRRLIMSFNTPLPECRLEGVSRHLLRERRGREAVRAHARVGAALRRAGARGGRAARSAQRRPGSRRRGGRAARRAPGRRPRQLHGLGGDRAAGSTRQPAGGSRRSASSSAARTPSSSATTRDLDTAVRWALASAFSNAGQRCASASRIVVFDDVYDAFRERLVAGARALEPQPVISEAEPGADPRSRRARSRGTGRRVLAGGERLDRPGLVSGSDRGRGRGPDAEISRTELFGPGHAPLPCRRPRRGDRARERLAVRPHGGDPHGERPSGDALRRAGRRPASSS